LEEQISAQGARLRIRGAGVTGYAKDILKDIIHAEAALVETVAPGAYTAVVAGKDDLTGVGLVEVYRTP